MIYSKCLRSNSSEAEPEIVFFFFRQMFYLESVVGEKSEIECAKPEREGEDTEQECRIWFSWNLASA